MKRIEDGWNLWEVHLKSLMGAMVLALLMFAVFTALIFATKPERSAPPPDEIYIDGTEVNELIDAGFYIVDPSGQEVRRFNADGSHTVWHRS